MTESFVFHSFIIRFSLCLMEQSEVSVNSSCYQRFEKYLGDRFHFRSLVWVFFVVNLLNYIERSIIPGSVVEIREYVQSLIGHDSSTYVGLLQSSFIMGFSVASILFGCSVSHHSPFLVICIGLSVWVVATLLSGCAWNYYILFVARLLSGVGEAAFQIVVPAFIEDYAPKDRIGSSMSLLYMAIPVGTAIGYTLSGFIAEHYSWRITYLISGPLMIPFIVFLFFYPVHSLEKDVGMSNALTIEPSVESKADSSQTLSRRMRVYQFLGDLKQMLMTPCFLLAVLGEAGCVFISSGFTSFGNVFLIQLRLFQSESLSAFIIGVSGCLAGIIGSCLLLVSL